MNGIFHLPYYAYKIKYGFQVEFAYMLDVDSLGFNVKVGDLECCLF